MVEIREQGSQNSQHWPREQAGEGPPGSQTDLNTWEEKAGLEAPGSSWPKKSGLRTVQVSHSRKQGMHNTHDVKSLEEYHFSIGAKSPLGRGLPHSP